MVIASRIRNIKNILNLFMHHQTKLIDKKRRKRKETDYLLHERALLSERIF